MESPITLLLFFSLIVLIKIPTTTANDDSENDLKMRISKVAPLAEMFLKKDPSKGRGLFSSNNSKKYHRQGQYAQPAEQKDYGGGSYGGGYEGGGHGGGGGYGGGYYEQYYDDYKDDLLPVLAVLALSSLLFYLITVATTSSTAGRRKRYTQDVSQEDIGKIYILVMVGICYFQDSYRFVGLLLFHFLTYFLLMKFSWIPVRG